jgi:hypothetical protein
LVGVIWKGLGRTGQGDEMHQDILDRGHKSTNPLAHPIAAGIIGAAHPGLSASVEARV